MLSKVPNKKYSAKALSLDILSYLAMDLAVSIRPIAEY